MNRATDPTLRPAPDAGHALPTAAPEAAASDAPPAGAAAALAAGGPDALRTLPAHQALLTALYAEVAAQALPAMCLALVDAAGELLLFHRMPASPERCIAIAQAKAYSAVRLRGSTAAFHLRLQRDHLTLADFQDPRLTALPGGDVAVDAAGRLWGGLGVSGGNPAQDSALTARLIKHLLGT